MYRWRTCEVLTALYLYLWSIRAKYVRIRPQSLGRPENKCAWVSNSAINKKCGRHIFYEQSSTNVAVLKHTYLVLIPQFLLGPGGSQHFVVRGTTELK